MCDPNDNDAAMTELASFDWALPGLMAASGGRDSCLGLVGSQSPWCAGGRGVQRLCDEGETESLGSGFVVRRRFWNCCLVSPVVFRNA